jgi:hypothetical protein
MLVNKVVKTVVERRTRNQLLGPVYLNGDFALFQYDGHDALVVHEETGNAHGVEHTRELELAVYHVTRVEVLQFLILDGLQVELATIERRNGRRALHVVRRGAGSQSSQKGEQIEYFVHYKRLFSIPKAKV